MVERKVKTPKEVEAPQSFSIEIHNPLRLFKNARNQAEKGEKSKESIFLSFWQIKSSVIESDMSALYGFDERDRKSKSLTFKILSSLRFSQERTSQEDCGFYSAERIKKIQEILEGNGLKTRLDTYRNRNYLQIMSSDVQVGVNFGFDNKTAYESEIKSDARREKRERGLYSDHTKYLLGKLRKGLTNEEVSFMSWKVHGKEKTVADDIELHLTSEEEFIRMMELYRNIYEKFIIALHIEDGKELPKMKMYLQNNGLTPNKIPKSA